MNKAIPFTPGLIVSCQAFPNEPLYGEGMMARMAQAAFIGGAVAIRTNGVSDVKSIKAAVPLPVIGLLKREISGNPVFITPELEDVNLLLAAGADIIALDVTNRGNRYEQARKLIKRIHQEGILVMADVSTLEEGIAAEGLGADVVSTTLSGYTPYSPQQSEPDLELVEALNQKLSIPIAAEGRIFTPLEAGRAIEAGATYVVVGAAITRPHLITKRFREAINDSNQT